MKKAFLLVCLLSVVAAVSAAAQTPGYTFDRESDFSKYKTYKWVSIPNAQKLDDLTSDQLTGSLEVELAKKGLTRSQSDNADLYLGYQIAPPDQKQLTYYDIGGSYGSVAGGNMATAATTVTVHSGRLVLYMYDATKKQLVWRGMVPNAIDANAKPDKKQKHMDKAVAKLLSEYPPKKKS
jgi:hypothetical protein